MSARLDAVLATINERFDAAEARIDRAERLARETELLRAVGESADQLVTVTVDGVGQMVDVRFAGDFHRAEGGRLAVDVLEAHAQAKRRLSFHVEEVARSVYGADVAAAAPMIDSYRRQFGYEEEAR